MVLESLISPQKAENKPMLMFVYGIIFSSIGVLLGLWIFKEQASLIMVFLTVFALIPLMYNTLRYEEEKEVKIKDHSLIFKEHWKALKFFMFLFLGITVSLSAWYVFLPSTQVETLFSAQISTIKSINARITGGSIASSVFFQIFSNNIKVLLFAVFFSFFYGAGAIFIITWNSSVIAGAIGTFIRENISKYIASTGAIKVASYFHIFSFGILRYLTHGIFEIFAYFIAGLAGGIISVAVIKHNLDSEKFRKIIIDSLEMIFLAIVVLLFAAFVEVFITPRLFS